MVFSVYLDIYISSIYVIAESLFIVQSEYVQM